MERFKELIKDALRGRLCSPDLRVIVGIAFVHDEIDQGQKDYLLSKASVLGVVERQVALIDRCQSEAVELSQCWPTAGGLMVAETLRAFVRDRLDDPEDPDSDYRLALEEQLRELRLT